ncbi:hypothetical protein AQUCO_00100220v1 [Aquilegia coerulea]|uniref:Uncharacterized protein n=1 Tax=Aquilegia coerulea TaxID=218851 RepID=A0A2G5F9A2_AQUCA|nr:hypothetical protein AQUCO_00100220v1 [Aquilegia coerulea]
MGRAGRAGFRVKGLFLQAYGFRIWSGLETWRKSSINENRIWGSKAPQQPSLSSDELITMDSCSSLSEYGALVLSTSDPYLNSALVRINVFLRLSTMSAKFNVRHEYTLGKKIQRN